MEYDSKKLLSYLFENRESAPVEDKFYFRVADGQKVVAHKWIIKEATTTLTENELVVPNKDIEKAHIETFLKFLYLKDLDLNQMTFFDMHMVMGISISLDLKEPVRMTVWESIKAAIVFGREKPPLAPNPNAIEGEPQRQCKRKQPTPNFDVEELSPQPLKKAKQASNKMTMTVILSTLHGMVENAEDGEAINLESRTYCLHEVLQITKENLTIQGSGPKTILKDMRLNPEDVPLLHLCRNGITMRNLTIELDKVVKIGSKWTRLPDRWGIYIEANDCKLEDLTLQNCGIIMEQYRNTLRHLKFHAENRIRHAIRISGEGNREVPGGDNILDDICINDYGIGIWLYGASQTGNTITNVQFKEVDCGVNIEASKGNIFINLKYECPSLSLVQENCAIQIFDGAKDNSINELECYYGFQEMKNVRSIFIGKNVDEDTLPEGNRVETWTGWGLLLPPMICDEGNNYVSEEGERPKPSLDCVDNADSFIIPQLTFE